jgi:hygromycin-B 7''-O-kinase
MTILPAIHSARDYTPLRRQLEPWLPALSTICKRHALPDGPFELYPTGSYLVAAAGPRHVIKLYVSVPEWPDVNSDFVSERTMLERVQGSLRVPTPELAAEGELEGWRYLVLSRLPGVNLVSVWDRVPPDEQLDVVHRLGETMAELHALPVGGLERIAVDWPAFMQARIDGWQQVQRQRGLEDEALMAQLPAYVQSAMPLYPASPPLVLLSADITSDHVLLEQRGGRWRIAGLFDFGDAMLGYHEYEFAAPATYITHYRPDLVRAMLLAYGYAPQQLDAQLARRLTAYELLHKYCHLRAVLDRQLNREKVTRLEQIQEALYPFA